MTLVVGDTARNLAGPVTGGETINRLKINARTALGLSARLGSDDVVTSVAITLVPSRSH